MTLREFIQDIRTDWKTLAGATLLGVAVLAHTIYNHYNPNHSRQNITEISNLEQKIKADKREDIKRQIETESNIRMQWNEYDHNQKIQELEKIGEELRQVEASLMQDKNQENQIAQETQNKYDSLSQKEKILLAKMLFGEARDCDTNTRIAIAYTALNRLDNPKRFGSTLKKVVSKGSYSCFNTNDPNKSKLINPANHDEARWFECLSDVERALETSDPTGGANHYYTWYDFKNKEKRESQEPYWAKGKKPTLVIEQDGPYTTRKQIRFYKLS